MTMKSVLKTIFKKKDDPKGKTEEKIAIKNPVDFNQLFFLYILYQWMQEKQQASNEKKHINSLIAINYFRLKKKYHFPDREFDNFNNMKGLPLSDYLDGLYKKKEDEGFISELNLSFTLTENGKKVVEIIKRGNYYDYDYFDKSIKFFNQGLIDSIDANIGKLTYLPDNSLIPTAIHHITYR